MRSCLKAIQEEQREVPELVICLVRGQSDHRPAATDCYTLCWCRVEEGLRFVVLKERLSRFSPGGSEVGQVNLVVSAC